MRKVAYPLSSNVLTELRCLETELSSLLTAAPSGVREAARLVFQAGGKRLRPALVVLCAMAGSYERKKVFPPAMAVELVHLASLVHDDILDGARTRRGAPTAAVAFGKETAARTGDYLFGLALRTVAASGRSELIEPLSTACMDLSVGELLQHETARSVDLSLSTYVKKISCKTASLFRAACAMGAISGNASASIVKTLAGFGWHLGMAFQIYDDVLDICGDEGSLGKPVGTDLREGTVTLPMLRAMQDTSVASLVSQAITGQLRGSGWVEKVLGALLGTDCVDWAKGEAQKFVVEAREAARKLPPGLVRNNLLSLGEFVVNRYH